jgi:hypothetical protein
MKSIAFDDSNWLATFPHRVMPLSNEWLPGLLLRCDEINHWTSGTSLMLSLHPLGLEISSFIVASVLNINNLARLLAVPEKVLMKTTYHSELALLYKTHKLRGKHLSEYVKFRFCPQCLEEARLLSRTLMLPQITCCLKHGVVLCHKCLCEAAACFYSTGKRPFTCHACGLHWARYPCVFAQQGRIAVEKKYLELYDFFLSRGTRLMLEHALLLIDAQLMRMHGEDFFYSYAPANRGFWSEGPPDVEKIPLSVLISVLVSFNLTISDILNYDSSQQRKSPKWRRFYISSMMEIFNGTLLIEDEKDKK